MKTLRTPGCSFSKDSGLQLCCPRSWGELSQDQLQYVFRLMSHQTELVAMKTMLFLAFTGLKVERTTPKGAWCWFRNEGETKRHAVFLYTWQVLDCIRQLDFVDEPEALNVRLDSIQGFTAVDVILNGVAFMDYLSLETWYQRMLMTRDMKWVDRMATVLYRDDKGDAATIDRLDDTERTAVVAWFTAIKATYARMFPHFFKPATGGEITADSIRRMATTQLRVLTDGDVSKLDIVKEVNCLDALSELNEKAREAAEFHRKYGS